MLIYLIDPFKQGYIFGYFLLLFLISNTSNFIFKLDQLGALILIFSLVYSTFYSFNPDLGIQFIFIYALFPITFYALGKYKYVEKPYLFQNTKGLILIAFIFSVTALISTTNSLLENGYNIINRNVDNFWTGLEENATYTGGFFALNMCIPGLLMINWTKSKLFYKILLVILFVLSLVCVLRLGSRTQLVISAFSIFVAAFYLMARQSSKKNLFFLSAIFILANIIITYVSIDKDSDFISAYTTRMESKKYGANTAGGRTERWEKSFEILWEKPLGWSLDEFGYSHNLWLDVLRVGGIISFILLLIVSFLSFKMLFKNLRRNKEIDPFLGTTAVFFMAFNLLFFVEPIFEGYFEIFVLHCFYLGLLSAYTKNKSSSAVETIKPLKLK